MADDAGADGAAEIAAIEQTMRTDFRAYQGDAVMQNRYGDLLAARDAGVAPGSVNTGDVGAEIASIEKTMVTDYRTYYNDAEMQSKYLELLKSREGVGSSAKPNAVDVEIAESHAGHEVHLDSFSSRAAFSP